MPTQPFTPAGVDNKVAEFYAMTDPDLLILAKYFADDLKSALNDHFTFTTDEGLYLTGMSDAAATAIGCQLAAVLLVRGIISMDPVPVQIKPRRPKEVRPDMTGGTVYVDGTSSNLSGDLSISIGWALV